MEKNITCHFPYFTVQQPIQTADKTLLEIRPTLLSECLKYNTFTKTKLVSCLCTI